jgi:serine/threonine protein kinase, bacterial
MKKLLPLLLLIVPFFFNSCKKTETYKVPLVDTTYTNPAPYVTTFAGNGKSGWVDGTKTLTSFTYPDGMTINADGIMYVADRENNVIRRISPLGDVITLSGNGVTGFANGVNSAAEFAFPSAVAVDGDNNVYVADQLNSLVRIVSASGMASTYAGTPGISGFANGTLTGAAFSGPDGIVLDNKGDVFVSDVGNNVIREITASGSVITFAGSGTVGNADGTGTAASFNQPVGLAVDGGNNIYVADEGNNEIRKISPLGVVTTIAGNTTAGNANGVGTAATFSQPTGVAVDAHGNIYVADSYNNLIRKITTDGTVSTYAGSGKLGYVDAGLLTSSFAEPQSVVVDSQGNVFVSDTGNNVIREIIQ